jgi:chromosome segregation ATPase
MTDIVEQLRMLQSGAAWVCGETAATLEDAADEIEQMGARITALEAERNVERANAETLDAICRRTEAERDAAIMDADMQAREVGNMEYNARILMDEITQLRENIKLLDGLWHEYHDDCVLHLEEIDRLKESLSIADAACRTYWGWEYGHDLDDDIPNSSLLVKWRHDYVKRK